MSAAADEPSSSPTGRFGGGARMVHVGLLFHRTPPGPGAFRMSGSALGPSHVALLGKPRLNVRIAEADMPADPNPDGA